MAWSHSIPTCILSIRVGSAMTLLSFQDLMCLGVWHNIVQYDIAMLFAIPALLVMYTSPLVFALYVNLFRKQEIFDELQPIYLGPHIFPSSPNFTPWRAVDIFFTFFHLFTGTLFSMDRYSEIPLLSSAPAPTHLVSGVSAICCPDAMPSHQLWILSVSGMACLQQQFSCTDGSRVAWAVIFLSVIFLPIKQ